MEDYTYRKAVDHGLLYREFNAMKIEFNEQQLGILNAALVELPYRIATPLIQHINQQIQEAHNKAYDDKEDLP